MHVVRRSWSAMLQFCSFAMWEVLVSFHSFTFFSLLCCFRVIFLTASGHEFCRVNLEMYRHVSTKPRKKYDISNRCQLTNHMLLVGMQVGKNNTLETKISNVKVFAKQLKMMEWRKWKTNEIQALIGAQLAYPSQRDPEGLVHKEKEIWSCKNVFTLTWGGFCP